MIGSTSVIMKVFYNIQWHLADDSPDRYERANVHYSREPPFSVEFVQAGPRLGWRWTNGETFGACEVHWLDEAPHPGNYDEYLKGLVEIEKGIKFYRGLSVPPTREEHERLCRENPLDPAPPMALLGDW